MKTKTSKKPKVTPKAKPAPKNEKLDKGADKSVVNGKYRMC